MIFFTLIKELGIAFLVFLGLGGGNFKKGKNAHPISNLTPLQIKLSFAAKKNHIDPAIVLAIVYKETRFNPSCASKTNDYGLFQIHCGKKFSWCRKFKIKPQELLDPDTNIKYGIKIIKLCKKRAISDCKKKECRHWLFYYNHDKNYVKSVLKLAKKYRKILTKTVLLNNAS